MNYTFDDVVIGAGQAGPFLAARLSAEGRSVALIERKQFGGTCVNTGCTPTKTMIASAAIAQHVRRAAEFGVYAGNTSRVSMLEVKARADAVVQQSRSGLQSMLEGLPHCRLFLGAATFCSSHEVEVSGDRLQAARFFINVGGRPRVPSFSGLENISHLTSSSILALTELPRHLVIVGGGYIGVEFAQMFRRFGSEVTLIEMGSRLAQHEDEDGSTAIRELLESEGVVVRLNAECIAFENVNGQPVAHVVCTAGSPSVNGSHVLIAVGRQPNTDDLGLANAGVAMDQRGYIRVDEKLSTTAPHIWAMGDCNGRGAFTHTAYNDYEIVAGNLLDGDDRKVSDRIPAYALYTDPPLAHIGLTETEARRTGRKLLRAERPMTKVGRALEKGETFGYMKALVDADTKRILGATIFGVGADEVIHSLLNAMYADAPFTTVSRSVGIHPTVSELLPTLLQDLRPFT